MLYWNYLKNINNIMGKYIFDGYSFSHFYFGMIWNYLGWNLISLVIMHILFEWFENSKRGMKIINNIPLWPGGKLEADSLLNTISDIIFAAFGWLFFQYFHKKVGFNNLGIFAIVAEITYWLNPKHLLVFIALAFIILAIFGKIYLILPIIFGYICGILLGPNM